jgi:3-hydroxyacyl-[acyl-carrier-protein] dehydratase
MQEIKKSMLGLSEIPGNNITARFIFQPDFTGFKGHFPGKPVLPGVCKIQAVISMIEKWHEKNVCLKEISLAKFFASVSCNQEILISSGKLVDGPDETKIRASVTSDGKKIAELHLKLSVKDRKF